MKPDLNHHKTTIGLPRIIASVLGLLVISTCAIAKDENETKDSDTDLILFLDAGVGHNDNIFESPDDDYIDFAFGTRTAIDPDKESGAYAPIWFRVIPSHRWGEKNYVITDYSYKADHYFSGNDDDADIQDQTLKLGYRWGHKNNTHVYAGVVQKRFREDYFDTDIGGGFINRAGDDASELTHYNMHGVELKAKYVINPRNQIRFEAHDEDYNYKKANADFAKLDYDRHSYEIMYQHNTEKNNRIRLKYFRQHDDRSEWRGYGRDARPDDGTTFDDTIKTWTLAYKHNFNDKTSLESIYAVTDRDDEYQGYNDTDAEMFLFLLEHKFTPKWIMEGMYFRMQSDMEHRYNFENVTKGKRDAEKDRYRLKAIYRPKQLREYYILWDHYDVDDSDERFHFDRDKFVVGLRYIFNIL